RPRRKGRGSGGVRCGGIRRRPAARVHRPVRPRTPQPKPAPPRSSKWPLLLLGLVLLAVLLLSLLRHLLEPQRLSDFLLRQAGDATGLAFELDSPADVSLWPDLHLVLNGLSVRAPG